MAEYDLTCNDCGSAFEVFSMGFLKDDQKKCSECGSTNVQQKITSFMCGGTSSQSGAPRDCPARAGSGFT